MLYQGTCHRTNAVSIGVGNRESWDTSQNPKNQLTSLSTPLQMFSVFGVFLIRDKFISETEYQAVLRVLVEEGESDLTGVAGNGQCALESYVGPTSSFTWLLDRAKSEIQYFDFKEPLWVPNTETFFTNAADLIRETFPERRMTRELMQQTDSDGYTILHHAVQRWSHTLSRAIVDQAELRKWELLIRDSLHAGADVYALPPAGKTPFLVLLSNTWRLRPRYEWRRLHMSRRSLRKGHCLCGWVFLDRPECRFKRTKRRKSISGTVSY